MSTLDMSSSLLTSSTNPYIGNSVSSINAGLSTSTFTDQSISTNPVERYTTDYYAGNQVCLFMGNLWLTDITSIQFQSQQQKTPFWGYKSQKFDKLARGTQIIQGVLSMNYIHTNYLNMAVTAYLKTTINLNAIPAGSQVKQSDIQNFASNLIANNGTIDPTTLQYTTSGNLANSLSNSNSPLNSLSFDEVISQFEAYFWGANPSAGGKQEVIAADNLPPFDITITYGGYPKDRVGTQGSNDEFQSSHTTKVLSYVSITGHSQQLGITGEPIQDIFTFIARSEDTPITNVPVQLVTPAASNTGNVNQ